MIPELLDLFIREGCTALGVVLFPDPNELGAVLGHNVKLQGIPVHLIEQRLDVLQHGVRQIIPVEDLLQIQSRDIRHNPAVKLIAVFECCQCAILGAGPLAGSVHGCLVLPLVPVFEHFLKSLLPVGNVKGVLVILRQGDISRHPIRKVPQDVITGVSPLVNTGVHAHLKGFSPAPGQLDYGPCAVPAPLSGGFRPAGHTYPITQGKAAMRAGIRLVRHLPGALRACCQCHVIYLLSLAGRLDQEMI